MNDTSPAIFIRESTAIKAADLIQKELGLGMAPEVFPYVVQGEMLGYVLFNEMVLTNDEVEAVI